MDQLQKVLKVQNNNLSNEYEQEIYLEQQKWVNFTLKNGKQKSFFNYFWALFIKYNGSICAFEMAKAYLENI